MSRFPLLTARVAAAGIVTPSAHAQFSNVDPLQAVHAVQQINQGVQLYSTTREQLQNVIDNYNLAKQMASSPSMLSSDLPVALPAVGGCFAIGKHLRQYGRLDQCRYERQRRSAPQHNR